MIAAKHLPPAPPQRSHTGFTLIELITATFILAVVIIGTVQATLSSLRVFNRGSTLDALETASANDLRWLRAYSKSWHCQVGPYQGCAKNAQGLASSLNYLPEIYSEATGSDYAKFKTLCNWALLSGTTKPANQFISDAQNAATAGLTPPPNPIATTETTISLSTAPSIAKQYKLYRSITVDSSGNSVDVSYYTKASDTPTLNFEKTDKLFIEATAWCP